MLCCLLFLLFDYAQGSRRLKQLVTKFSIHVGNVNVVLLLLGLLYCENKNWYKDDQVFFLLHAACLCTWKLTFLTFPVWFNCCIS